MSQEKYIGMDVHQATISAAVRNGQGKLLMEKANEEHKLVLSPTYPMPSPLKKF